MCYLDKHYINCQFTESWMSNFEIRVGDSDESNFSVNGLCAFRPGRMPCGQTETLYCEQPLVSGRYVSLQVGDPEPDIFARRSLSFCELQAFGILV